MRHHSLFQSATARALAAIVLSGALGAAHGDDVPPPDPGAPVSIVGSWKNTVQFTRCDFLTPLRTPFPALNSFFADGNVIENGSGISPALRSISHGSWQRIGKRVFIARSEIQLFDTLGAYYADQIIERRLELSEDGKSLTSRARVTRIGTDGVVTAAFCATETGGRLPQPVGP